MDTAFVFLLKKLEERRMGMVGHLVQGTISDHAEYKFICGVIQGLDHAAAEIKDLATKMEQDDE